jgi:hypothetical protein
MRDQHGRSGDRQGRADEVRDAVEPLAVVHAADQFVLVSVGVGGDSAGGTGSVRVLLARRSSRFCSCFFFLASSR